MADPSLPANPIALEGASMVTYRLYRVSDLTPRFEPAKEFEANDDAAAIVIAEKARARRAAELWNGSRMIKEWKD